MIRRLVILPPAPALLPRYASLEDPVADVRRSAVHTLAAVVEDVDAVRVVGNDPFASEVAATLLDAAGFTGRVDADADVVVVMANGSAKRTEKAPGHLDDRAADFDDALDLALRSGDGARLAALDTSLADELWSSGIDALTALGAELGGGWRVSVPYADDPHGVLWWVAAWVR